ncbi:putative profilin [Chaetomidium leptoderma]|uniref:Profilin n=1 Tax=Chaetomidium leptoderma TaxID=669021 RepID=A0AAN6VC94_9PEZI|nr:putative profilin [Chaetomidium leptoderma]
MSWQELTAAYIDTSLVGSGHIDKASIISVAGDSTWATTPDFAVGADEIKTLIAILNDPDKQDGPAVKKAFEEGIHVAGERYVATRVEEGHVYGRKGKTGICIVKTKQAILIGHYGENVQAGNATQTVEALALYLTGLGY